RRPERFRNRHLNRSPLGKRLEDTVGLAGLGDVQNHGKTLWLLETVRRGIAPDEVLVPQREGRVNDLFPPLARNLLAHGRLGPGHHHRDLSAQYFLIELEGGFALSIER